MPVIDMLDFGFGLDRRGGDNTGQSDSLRTMRTANRFVELTNFYVNNERRIQTRGGVSRHTDGVVPDGYHGIAAREGRPYLVALSAAVASDLGMDYISEALPSGKKAEDVVGVEDAFTFGDGVYTIVRFRGDETGDTFAHYFSTIQEATEGRPFSSLFPELIGLTADEALARMPKDGRTAPDDFDDLEQSPVVMAAANWEGLVVYQSVAPRSNVESPAQLSDYALPEMVSTFPGVSESLYPESFPDGIGFGGVSPLAVPDLYGSNQPVSGMAEFGVSVHEDAIGGISSMDISVLMPDGDEHLLVRVEGSVRFPMVSPSGWTFIGAGVYLWSKPDNYSFSAADSLFFPNWYTGEGDRRAVFIMFKLGADRQVRSHWRGYWQ